MKWAVAAVALSLPAKLLALADEVIE